MDKYMPINVGELSAMQILYRLNDSMRGDENLKKRFESIGKWWRYRGALKTLENLFDDLLETIEPVRRNRIRNLWSKQELRIVNTSTPVDTSGDVMVVPKSCVVRMAKKCQSECCSMCLGTNEDKKGCEFRRAMLELSIPDLRKYEKKTGKCVGHLYDWSANDV